MLPAKRFPAGTLQMSFLLCLIILQVTLIQSVTVNPNHDTSESTTPSQRDWKSSFHRNNKEIKFIPSHKEDKKVNTDVPVVKNDSGPLSRAHVYGQRKQNLENSETEGLKMRRVNLLNSLKTRNNPKVNATKESNKIDIILLPQDETEEVSTRPSSYRRRYRKNKNRQHHRNAEKSSEETTKQEKHESEKHQESEEVKNTNQNETNEDSQTNRLFNKNKRRLFGNRHSNKVNKETPKNNEKQNEEEKADKVEKENNYKIDLNENKKEENNKYVKEDKRHNESESEQKPQETNPEESSEESSVNREKEYEKTEKLVQKYRVPTVSTLATPIEILSTNPSSYYETNNYNKASPSLNGLSNMQLLHTLGMRKVRQPNHHNKRHQQDSKSKSRSQYNMNSDSQMYIVKLPPQPYYYHNEKPMYNIKPKNNVPITMVNNGKIDKIYHYNLPLVEKLMTGRKTYSNKAHKIHDPVQPYFGPYSHNEYDVMTKKPLENKKPLASNNKKFDSDSLPGNSYHKTDSTHDYKKVIPVHEENTSFEQTDKQLDSRHDFTKFTPSASEEIKKFNVKDDYKNFDASEAFNKFDAQEHYKKLFSSSLVSLFEPFQ
ncbi:component of gems protein 1-like [Diaphorina citri]|uniref:Component of gems protein 1-like n=1 Tax=Diaphorina citri TaxID=121845 RepID=A0A1S3DEU4_DIACI|nr:component of gems protein 1-like [Diaphorina citri]